MEVRIWEKAQYFEVKGRDLPGVLDLGFSPWLRDRGKEGCKEGDKPEGQHIARSPGD